MCVCVGGGGYKHEGGMVQCQHECIRVSVYLNLQHFHTDM